MLLQSNLKVLACFALMLMLVLIPHMTPNKAREKASKRNKTRKKGRKTHQKQTGLLPNSVQRAVTTSSIFTIFFLSLTPEEVTCNMGPYRYLVRVWQESSAAWHRRQASLHRWLIRASRAAPRPCPSSCCRPAVARVTTPTCCCPLIPFTSLLHCLNISQQLRSRRQSLSFGMGMACHLMQIHDEQHA